jgi:hypothetical protein
MSNNDFDDLDNMFKSMQVGPVKQQFSFGAPAAQVSLAAAIGARNAAVAAGADPSVAEVAAGAAGAAVLKTQPVYAQKSKKRATPRRTTQRETAQNLKVKKDLKELQRLMAAHDRERRLRARSGIPYKGRLSKKKGRETLSNRLYRIAMASLNPKSKSTTRRRPVKNTVMK